MPVPPAVLASQQTLTLHNAQTQREHKQCLMPCTAVEEKPMMQTPEKDTATQAGPAVEETPMVPADTSSCPLVASGKAAGNWCDKHAEGST